MTKSIEEKLESLHDDITAIKKGMALILEDMMEREMEKAEEEALKTRHPYSPISESKTVNAARFRVENKYDMLHRLHNEDVWYE